MQILDHLLVKDRLDIELHGKETNGPHLMMSAVWRIAPLEFFYKNQILIQYTLKNGHETEKKKVKKETVVPDASRNNSIKWNKKEEREYTMKKRVNMKGKYH